ncbi:MAG: FAD-dependent monooxygenase, partial [Pseudorhodobacter sp.]|nr:FAD-dependent monooxygenase [Pseudorhodobacter sp.]
VLEQADVLREVGAGIQISPNGARVLQALGLALDEPRAVAVELRDGLDDSLVTRLEVGRLRPDQGYHFMHRADLIGLLQAGAIEAGVEMRLLSRVAAVDLGEQPVLRMEDGSTVEAGLLIGADGMHSAVRQALNGVREPEFTGQVAWRALIAGDRGAPVVEVHMGPGRHLVTYPLRGGTLRNIVAVEERRNWAAESWSLRDDPIEVRLAFKGFSPRVRDMLEQVDDVHLWGLFRHPVASVWQRALPGGAVAILGDAAHPTLPFLAQGANMALEDAWVLAAALAAHDSLAAGLAAYQQARSARCGRIVQAAARNARAYHLAGLPRTLAHAGLRLGGWLMPELALRRFDWLYGFDVTRQGASHQSEAHPRE